jgi:CheY-like chemotaxis protein
MAENFPVALEARVGRSCAPQMQPRFSRRTGASPIPVLLVEDDPDLREVLAEILGEEGFTVRTAEDGLEAVAALAQMPRPTLVLLDWMMPRLDCAGLLSQLETQRALEGLIVIVMTHFEGTIEDARVTRVLRKPYEFDALMEMLEQLCYPARSESARL